MLDKAKSSRRKTVSLQSNISSETASTLYQSLLSYYIHQDQLYWNSTQLLIVVQAGVLNATLVNAANQPVASAGAPGMFAAGIAAQAAPTDTMQIGVPNLPAGR